jgi:iron-sulfur cluster repair protein YtfE (RIC family)
MMSCRAVVTSEAPAARTFLSLMKVHEELNELFYLHQEALLTFDILGAFKRLTEFEGELRKHMSFEEEALLPIYERAGRIPGGLVVFFTGEHRRMLEFLERFRATLERLVSRYSATEQRSDTEGSASCDDASLKREIIQLFDQEALFKHLVEHHDLREQNILYPTLDRVTDDAEKREMLGVDL